MTVLIDPQSLSLGLLVLTRVSGLMIAAPVLSRSTIPQPLKALLATGITAAMLPMLPVPESGALVERLVGELALGVALGFTVELLFAAVDLASAALSFGTGMSYQNAVDPNSPVRATAIMTVQWLMTTLLFLAVDGHHLLFQALSASFTLVPPGAVSAGGIGQAVAAASLGMFSLGLALAAPALVVLALVDIALGLVGRVAPQVPALLIGMGMKPLAGFMAMAAVYGALPGALSRGIDELTFELGQIVMAAS